MPEPLPSHSTPPAGPSEAGRSGWSELWQTEDYWAIWLGFALIAVGLAIFLPRRPADLESVLAKVNPVLKAEAERAPLKTVGWHLANDAREKIKATNEAHGQFLLRWLARPHGWSHNPLDAFYVSPSRAAALSAAAAGRYEAAKSQAQAALEAARAAEAAAEAAGFQDPALNARAQAAIDRWRTARSDEAAARKKATVEPHVQAGHLLGLGVAMGLMLSLGMWFMGHSVTRFLRAFGVVFLLACVAEAIAAQSAVKASGIESAAWAILLGLLISNILGTPAWLSPAVQVEYYIKIGLVLLGAEVLLGKVLVIGLPGLFVAWAVTPVVLIATYRFGDRVLKIASKKLNITLSAAMSVCGVSAAIATAGACRARKEELTLAVGISLVFTVAMMVGMPAFIAAVGMDHVIGGAWIGGTIDATGAVAAAGAFLGDKAFQVAAVIKMIQNSLIGVIAFGVALYWCARVEAVAGQRASPAEIWIRFPKFVLGFMVASMAISLISHLLGADASRVLLDEGLLKGFTKPLREWFFALAFVSIGLATNFRELAGYLRDGKLLALYVFGQGFNLVLTLAMAYVMFGLVFPGVAARI